MSEGVPLDEEMFDVAAVEAGAWSPGPYGAGDAGPRVAEVLATVEIGQALIQKKMTY